MHFSSRHPSIALFLTLLLSLSDLARPAQSQQTESVSVTKPSKPCFWEMEKLPDPPLSQSEPSIPNLWLAQELYGYSTLEPEQIREVQRKTDIQLYVEQPPEEVIEESPDEVIIEEAPDELIEESPEEVIEESPEELIEEPSDEPIIEGPSDELVEDRPDELSEYRILETWYVEPQITQLQPDLYVNNLVTLVVNLINWNREKYIGQYVFVTRFASVTRSYGYNLRVCSPQGELLAYYVCNFEQTPLNCQAKILSDALRFRNFRNFNAQ